MRVLLTVIGTRDPWNTDGTDGPNLSLLEFMNDFDEVHLFFTSDLTTSAEQTKKTIEERHPSIKVLFHPLNLEDPYTGKPDPTNYAMILSELRRHVANMDFSAHSYAVYTSPGTTVMHTCWVLLAASREIVASLIQKPDPRHLTPGKPPITEIVPDDPSFPEIRQRQRMPSQVPSAIPPEDIAEACKEAGIVGNHQLLLDAIERAAMVARTDSTVMISGETGTGKELIARLIHILSRRTGDFVTVNCSAIPENLIESNLFGYEGGAFSGADRRGKKGLVEAAQGGTLFLDEIGDMSLGMQAKILRVIQEKKINRVGGTRPIDVDFRLITATHRDLRAMVREGTFREDLFYRLSVIPIEMPPLRQRKSDIPLLAQHFLDNLKRKTGKTVRFSPEACSFLLRHNWRGNIRELRTVVEGAHTLTKDEEILPDTLTRAGEPDDFFVNLPDPYEGFKWEWFRDMVQYRMYTRALEIAGGVQKRAASLLGVTSQRVSAFVETRGVSQYRIFNTALELSGNDAKMASSLLGVSHHEVSDFIEKKKNPTYRIDLFSHALELSGNDVGKASERLGISSQELSDFLKEHPTSPSGSPTTKGKKRRKGSGARPRM